VKEIKAIKKKKKPVRGELVTVNEAIKYTRLGRTSLYESINKGYIRYFRPKKGKILFDTADLDDYLSKCEVPASTTPGNI
jgi:excisionase family DNA binding protein